MDINIIIEGKVAEFLAILGIQTQEDYDEFKLSLDDKTKADKINQFIGGTARATHSIARYTADLIGLGLANINAELKYHQDAVGVLRARKEEEEIKIKKAVQEALSPHAQFFEITLMAYKALVEDYNAKARAEAERVEKDRLEQARQANILAQSISRANIKQNEGLGHNNPPEPISDLPPVNPTPPQAPKEIQGVAERKKLYRFIRYYDGKLIDRVALAKYLEGKTSDEILQTLNCLTIEPLLALLEKDKNPPFVQVEEVIKGDY